MRNRIVAINRVLSQRACVFGGLQPRAVAGGVFHSRAALTLTISEPGFAPVQVTTQQPRVSFLHRQLRQFQHRYRGWFSQYQLTESLQCLSAASVIGCNE